VSICQCANGAKHRNRSQVAHGIHGKHGTSRNYSNGELRYKLAPAEIFWHWFNLLQKIVPPLEYWFNLSLKIVPLPEYWFNLSLKIVPLLEHWFNLSLKIVPLPEYWFNLLQKIVPLQECWFNHR